MAASTAFTSTTLTDLRIVRRKYRWPACQLNFWLFIFLVASSVVLGVFASFSAVQSQLMLGTPWYFTYSLTTGALGILFVVLLLYLINQRSLLPGIVILGAFILFVLWIVGLIVVSIELWGPQGNVSGNCQMYIVNQQSSGRTAETLAWLMQSEICQSWKAAWAFQLVGTAFLVWIMVMSYQVYQDD